MRNILLSIFGISLWSLTAFADPIGTTGVYIDGNIQPAAGTVTTNAYANGSGAANSNTVDHALYANAAGGVLGGMTTNVYANGSGSNNVNKVDHASYADAAPVGAHNQAWSTITNTPTTILGYGITDAVNTNDSRLTDARIPLAHNQGWTTITNTPTTIVGYGLTDAVNTNDIRLTDARIPLAHNQGWTTITNTPTTIAGYGLTDAVNTNDSRLTDARVPLAHNQAWTTITNTPTTIVGYGLTDAVNTNDSRLTDARVPLAHNQGWTTITNRPTTIVGYGLTDAVNTNDSRLTDARVPLAHNQGWTTITNTPTTIAGYGLTDAVNTNDSRLTDARVPLAHNQDWSTVTNKPNLVNSVNGSTGDVSVFAYSIADSNKLAGIQNGATSNSPDATLLARANHTGTQAWSTITNTPTTIAGYGLTDAVNTNDSRLTDARVPLAHNQGWTTITNRPTTIAGYGLTDAVNTADWKASLDPIGVVWEDQWSLTFSNADRTLYLNPVGASADYYFQGTKISKTGVTSKQISTNYGTHFVYFNDASGTLTESANSWGFSNAVQVATVYWTPSSNGLVGSELHGIDFPWSVHEIFHTTLGTRYASGLAGTFSATNLSIATGVIYDEDLKDTIPTTNKCRIFYHNGATTYTEFTVQTNVVWYGGTNVLSYDTGTNLAAVSSGNFAAYWVYATTMHADPVISVMGNRQDTTLAAARTNNTPDTLSIGALPSQEMKLLYRVIFHRTGGSVLYDEAQDYRAVTTVASGTYTPTAHGSLTGLNNDDHIQYVLADGTRNQTTLDTLYTTSQTFAMSAATTTNFALSGLQWNVPTIVRGCLYIADTNTIPFSKTATVTFRNAQARASGEAIWQADMLMSAVTITNDLAIGATNALVSDGTDFSANNLIYVGGTTNEFVRLLSVSGNNLIFKYACTNAHTSSNVCARVREFGGFKTYDSSSSKTIWGSVDFSTATTGNLKMDLEYAK